MKYLIGCLAMIFGSNAVAVDVQLRVVDENDVGFNSTESYSIEGYPFNTLGEARKYALGRVETAIEYGFKGDSYIIWDVRFKENPGYLAVTLGPVMSAYYEGAYQNDGFFELGRHYPNTLVSNRVGAWQGVVTEDGSPEGDAITDFGGSEGYFSYTDSNQNGHRFISTALHEMVHVLGFTSGDCLGNCFPERSSIIDHTSKYKFFFDGAELIPYDLLSLDEKEAVQSTQDDFLFIGSAETQAAASQELVDGFSQSGLELHAELGSNGLVDPQNGAHFAPQMEPAQLMHSAGKDVLDLGMAAYFLCDIGWCRGNGRVIDISVQSTLPPDITDNKEFTVRYQIIGDASYDINSANFDLNIDDELNIIQMNDPDQICQQNDNVVLCEGVSFGIGEVYSIDLKLSGQQGNYQIRGGVKSNNYDVDRRPFSNLVNDFISISSAAPEPEPAPAPTPERPQNQTSSSGGSMGNLIVVLLCFALYRRYKR